jgi:hypothetical protein
MTLRILTDKEQSLFAALIDFHTEHGWHRCSNLTLLQMLVEATAKEKAKEQPKKEGIKL